MWNFVLRLVKLAGGDKIVAESVDARVQAVPAYANDFLNVSLRRIRATMPSLSSCTDMEPSLLVGQGLTSPTWLVVEFRCAELLGHLDSVCSLCLLRVNAKLEVAIGAWNWHDCAHRRPASDNDTATVKKSARRG